MARPSAGREFNLNTQYMNIVTLTHVTVHISNFKGVQFAPVVFTWSNY